MQNPLLTASLGPPITSRPVRTPFLGGEEGKTVNRAGPGREDWDGAGGSVWDDPGRVLLSFGRGWGESWGEKETARGCRRGHRSGREVWNALGGMRRYQGS